MHHHPDATAHPARPNPLLEVRELHRGRRAGDAYVRVIRPFNEEFARGASGDLVATEQTVLRRRGWHAKLRALRTVLIGRPISTEREAHERLTKLKALAIFSSDNISSSAYATEEMMRILVVAGIGAMSLTMPLTIVICAVLAVVATSYWQTIHAYPQGASSYLVSSDNLGAPAGLVAGASLLIDYTLTVAVSVSAAVAAITSIAPGLFDVRVLVGLVIVAVLMLGNLRGVRESGTLFMAPTYLYIATIVAMVGIGLLRQATGTLPEYHAPAAWLATPSGGIGAVGILLVLRAFSSGSAALTGVEAISDGVPAFKPQEWRNARITLVWAAAIFATLFLGISYLASSIGVVPDPGEQQTVLSQIGRTVFGDGPMLVVLQAATVLVLALAANTAFADFPRLSSFLARDGFMPRQFGFRGERLAFTTGIVALSGLAAVLLVVFGASVTALIPLYTLGVFLAFTLSQTGMVVRWRRRREPGWRRGLVINGIGALTTGVIALIVVESKFMSGAWMVVIAIPLLVLMMLAIRSHYRGLDRALAVDGPIADATAEPIVVVPIARLDEPARQALAFARSIADAPLAVHVATGAADTRAMRRRWRELDLDGELVIVESPYRALIGPLLAYLDALQRQDPSRPVLVILSEFVPRHWWELLLHNQTALRLKLRLFARRNTMVADLPFHLRR
jgi:amino acid transporter